MGRTQQIFYSCKRRFCRAGRTKFSLYPNACRAMIENFRKISHTLLDFMFGVARPQPDALETDSEAAWQRWLTAGIETEDTLPMPGTTRPQRE